MVLARMQEASNRAFASTRWIETWVQFFSSADSPPIFTVANLSYEFVVRRATKANCDSEKNFLLHSSHNEGEIFSVMGNKIPLQMNFWENYIWSKIRRFPVIRRGT